MLYPHKLRCINNRYTNRKLFCLLHELSWGPHFLTELRNEVPRKVRVIDLFRLSVMFSQYRSYGDSWEVWTFVVFIKRLRTRMKMSKFDTEKSVFFQIWTFPFLYAVFLMNKGSNLPGIAIWSLLGKHNRQAKKVYSKSELMVLVSFILYPVYVPRDVSFD